METLTETEAYRQYHEYRDELEPLNNFPALSFSGLLSESGGITYNAGFTDFCEQNNIEIV